MIRNEYVAELGAHANDFFQTLDDLHQEGLLGRSCFIECQVSEKINVLYTILLGHKLIICGRSVSWWDEGICQLVKDHRACFAQGLDKDSY